MACVKRRPERLQLLGAEHPVLRLAATYAYLAPRMRNLRLDGEAEFGSIKGIYAMESVPIAFDPA